MTKRKSIFNDEFQQLSDQQLIDRFNGDVNNPGWVTARGDFHAAMHHEFVKRGWDISEIGDQFSHSLAFKVRLEGKKIIKA